MFCENKYSNFFGYLSFFGDDQEDGLLLVMGPPLQFGLAFYFQKCDGIGQ